MQSLTAPPVQARAKIGYLTHGMTYQQVMSSHAMRGQKYFGISSSGQRIYIVRTPRYNNNIFTAWFEPVIDFTITSCNFSNQ